MIRLLKFLVLLLVLVGIASLFSPPVKLFALKAAGRGPVCPLANALKADENLQLQIRYKDELIRDSKLLEQDSKGFHYWQTPMGNWWIPKGDDWVLPYNLAEQKRKIYGTGANDVKAGDIVLDCGANVGVFTRVALDNGAKLVVGIEPAPDNLESYRRNFKDEIAAGRVIVVPKGVWDKDDLLTLNVDPNNTAADSFIIERQGGIKGVEVPLLPIDKLVKELNLPRVDYIKMDIEGAEQKALAGAQETLAKYHPRLSLASYHVPSDPAEIPKLVRQAWPGYSMECGPCAEGEHHTIRPDVLYFK